MKLNYYILWVEDDDSWFKTTSELFSETINDYGFNPIIERKKTFDDVKNNLINNGLKKFDIFLIDFKLRNSKDGDSIVNYVRNNNIYTDIIFYSSDKQSIIDSIKEHLFEGVYHSDRKEIEDKFEKVFETTIKKIEEINSMRGLVVGETSELDSLIEDILLIYIKSPFIKNFNLDKFIEKEIINNLEKRKDKINELYISNGLISILPQIDAMKKWQLLRGILKKNIDNKNFISEFMKINSTYFDEVIDIRNKFAHAKVITDPNGKEYLKSQVGDDHYEYHEKQFKIVRENLLKHRNALMDCLDKST